MQYSTLFTFYINDAISTPKKVHPSKLLGQDCIKPAFTTIRQFGNEIDYIHIVVTAVDYYLFN
jgi:hypothetical protein